MKDQISFLISSQQSADPPARGTERATGAQGQAGARPLGATAPDSDLSERPGAVGAMSAGDTLAEDVHAAKRGDSMAWARLVRRFTPQIRAVARRRGLAAWDQDEVAQRTWLALLKGIHSVQQPLALPGWLHTTAHRESLRVRREAARDVPTEEVGVAEAVWDVDVDDVRDARERQERVRKAVERIPGRQHELLQTLVAEPALSYDEISRRLDMPVGSIGPTRARCLARLRRDPYLAGLVDEVPSRRTTRPAPSAPDSLSQ